MNNITFIGLGKLGLPLSLLIEKAGFNVLGIDISEKYVTSLNNKSFKCNEPSVNEMIISSKKFNATTNLIDGIHHSNYIFILVNSSFSLNSYYDMSIISDLLIQINNEAKSKKHIIISSTIQIGYISKIGKFLINNDDYNHTINYFPEFVRIGKVIEDITNCSTPFLIGSEDINVQQFLINLLEKICCNGITPSIHTMSPESAEIAKFTGNCFKTIKISFSNMIGDICDKTPNTDKNKIMEAIKSDKIVQTGCFIPGYGYGGPCFPRDNIEFSNFIKSLNINTCLLDSTDEYNNYHAEFQAQQFLDQNIDEYIFKNVCYRKDIDVPVIEASQKLKVAELIVKNGKKVIIEDNKDVINLIKKQYGNIFEYSIIK